MSRYFSVGTPGDDFTEDFRDAEVTATGSTTPRSLAARAADVVNVKNHGLVCDGVTDDSTAMDAMLSTLASAPKALVVSGPCLLNSNFTIPWNMPIRFDGDGSFVGAGTVAYTTWANATPDGVSFPFTTPGAYATGTILGTKGKAITETRSTIGTYRDANGVRQNAAINALRVESLGALVEWTRTQLYPTPTAPAAGTVTFASLGAHTFWVEGTGSQTLTASGTLVATGLPATATEAAPAVFTVTTLGATPMATLSALTGTLTAAQIELGGMKSSLISALGARGSDTLVVPSPLKPGDLNWCILMDYTPNGKWTPTENANGRIFASGAPGSANSILGTFHRYGGSNDNLSLSAYDAAGAERTWRVAHFLGDQTTHKLAFCNAAGHLTIYVDGIKYLDTAGSGGGLTASAGSGIVASPPATIDVLQGSLGKVKNFKFYRTADPFSVGYAPAILDFDKVACIGDSLTFGTGGTPYPTQLGTLLGAGWMVDNWGIGGAQLAALRIVPWQHNSYTSEGVNNNQKLYGWVALCAGTNDFRNAAATADDVYGWSTGVWQEVRESGRRILPITIPPRSDSGWTAGMESYRQNFNARLIAWFTARGLPYVDAATALDDGTGKLQTIYDSGDHLHLSTAGYALVASMVQAAILAYP